MMNIEQKLEELKNGFWTSLDDLVAEIENIGVTAEDWCCEYVVVSYEEDGDDVQVEIRLGGTERTIIVVDYREICRW